MEMNGEYFGLALLVLENFEPLLTSERIIKTLEEVDKGDDV
jgi:hypothetical protein